ncbi:MAG: alpha/beta fold hydrolase [Myxococcota bacterium]|jgi:putative redox protein|nr:alpha/beta fold hydrolase [Myxococcota bacterium]
MPTRRFDFLNSRQHRLAGRLELPAEPNESCAIVCHCFTCTKDSHTAARLSRNLSARGITCLRFDFEGLGGSEGDFSQTNLSTNIDDLRAAIDAMQDAGYRVELLVGHSFGGAACLRVGGLLDSVRAVVTLGTTCDNHALEALVVSRNPELARADSGEVEIGARRFLIRRQLFEDTRQHPLWDYVSQLQKPLLVLHAEKDELIPRQIALKQFERAQPLASFIGLPGGDHMLTDRHLAARAADAIALWWQMQQLEVERRPLKAVV